MSNIEDDAGPSRGPTDIDVGAQGCCCSGIFQSAMRSESARGLAHSKTLARRISALENAERLGLRQPSGAFQRAPSSGDTFRSGTQDFSKTARKLLACKGDDMSRTQKKCFMASIILHGLLLTVILFGAAFKSKPKPIPYQRINVVPSRLVESAQSGGGGDPALPRTDDRVRGHTLTPQPAPVAAPQPQPRPAPPPPQPRPETRPPEPVKPAVKPADIPKPDTTAKAAPPKLDLTPTIRNNNTKAREKTEADARAARAADQRDANLRREIASKLGQPATGRIAGFESGTKVNVGGEGGEAYANYALFVREAYENAWQVPPDLASEDFAVTIEVTVARNGRVIRSRIANRSGSASMDRSIQRALDKVKTTGLREFPAESKDSERTFSIEFNLKAKRLAG